MIFTGLVTMLLGFLSLGLLFVLIATVSLTLTLLTDDSKKVNKQ